MWAMAEAFTECSSATGWKCSPDSKVTSSGNEPHEAAELMKVDFHGDQLEAVKDGDKVWVSLRRCCENLGIALGSQLTKLKNKPWATVMFFITVADDGKPRVMAMLALDSLPLWLATIDTGKVKRWKD